MSEERRKLPYLADLTPEKRRQMYLEEYDAVFKRRILDLSYKAGDDWAINEKMGREVAGTDAMMNKLQKLNPSVDEFVEYVKAYKGVTKVIIHT